VKKLYVTAVLLAELSSPFVAAKPKIPNVDWYFPVRFGPGTTLSLKFSAVPNSTVKSTRHIILQPWLPDGSPRRRSPLISLLAGRPRLGWT
jgi:hypothetical protein